MFKKLILSLIFVFGLFGLMFFERASAQSFPEVSIKPYVSGLDKPLNIANPGDGTNRLFVVEQVGRIRVIENDSLLNEPFLDISSKVACCYEQGLLSIAFSPNYESNGYFYVNYTNKSGNTTISRFSVLSANPNRADSSSEEIILTVNQPAGNHNGGHMEFGPDGYLYIGMGDGGGSGGPNNNGQNKNTLLGKMLRIDPENASGSLNYSIPSSNPFYNQSGARGEIWAYGLRNPWRFTFDSKTGDLYIADVGQFKLEEVNFQSANSSGGQNYGWRIMEGTSCFNPSNCSQDGITLPVAEYNHSQGCSITGGVVYRGYEYLQLDGIYFYADYCSGRFWGLRKSGNSWQNEQILTTQYEPTSFGRDKNGRVFFTDFANNAVYEITGITTPASGTPSPTSSASPTASSAIPGDGNFDGRVDGLDFVIWVDNYGNSNVHGAHDGDFNNDEKVDGLDFVIWVDNYTV